MLLSRSQVSQPGADLGEHTCLGWFVSSDLKARLGPWPASLCSWRRRGLHCERAKRPPLSSLTFGSLSPIPGCSHLPWGSNSTSREPPSPPQGCISPLLGVSYAAFTGTFPVTTRPPDSPLSKVLATGPAPGAGNGSPLRVGGERAALGAISPSAVSDGSQYPLLRGWSFR